MAPGGGHFEGALDVFLALDLAEVGRRDGRNVSSLRSWLGSDGFAPGQMVVELGEGTDGEHFQIGDEGSLGCVRFGHYDPLEPVLAGGGGHRQDSARMADGPIQR